MSEYMTRMRFFWQCLDPSVFGKAQFLITMVTKIVNKQLYSDKHKHMYIHIYIYIYNMYTHNIGKIKVEYLNINIYMYNK